MCNIRVNKRNQYTDVDFNIRSEFNNKIKDRCTKRLFFQALVGYADSEQFHIFELTKHLPRFAMYTTAPTMVANKIESNVTFRITERLQRICIWINQNFLLEEELEIENEDAKELDIHFLNLRDKTLLLMNFAANGQVKFTTQDIGLAGDLIQSLANYLNLSDLQHIPKCIVCNCSAMCDHCQRCEIKELMLQLLDFLKVDAIFLRSTANFPDTEHELRQQMTNASEVGETRSRLAAETAEKAQLITALLPVAQDAANYDLTEMLHRYREVILLNEELLTGCHVRRSIQEQAVGSLKNLHVILRHAARLRVGKYSKAVITACRKAVQDNNTDALIKILQVGDC